MKKLLAWGLPIAILGALVAWRFTTKKEETGQMQQQSGARRNMPASVELATAEPRVILSTVEAVGTLESPFRVELSPKTSGRIEHLVAREGDTVKPGQVLVRIDPSELRAQVLQQQAAVAQARSRLAEAQLGRGATDIGISSQIRQQQAAVASARADLSQVQRNHDSLVATADAGEANAVAEVGRQQANLKNAQTRLARIEDLYRKGYTAAQDVDDARTVVEVQRGALSVAQGQLESAKQQAAIVRRKGQADIESAKARLTQAQASLNVALANRSQSPAFAQNIAALRANVRAMEAQLGQARARLSDTVLRSPIKGTVTARTGDQGSMASPGTPVLVVQFLDWLYVSTSLPIDRVGVIRQGQGADIRFDAIPNRIFRGKVSHINPAADVANRQFGIKIRLANPGHVLKPGMFGKVSFVLDRVEALVAVPREAVKTGPEGQTIAVVDKEMTAHVNPVKLGAQDDKFVQILRGVKPGDKIVRLSFQPVRDGQKIRPPGERGGRGRGQGGEGSPPSATGEGRGQRGRGGQGG